MTAPTSAAPIRHANDRLRTGDTMSTITAKRERPILFSAPMVRAILDDRKTQSRRILKATVSSTLAKFHRVDKFGNAIFTDGTVVRCPYGQPGDQLWVRETFYIDWTPLDEGPLPKEWPDDLPDDCIYYLADGNCCAQIPECQCASEGKPRWRPSIHMPRWASRITLEITGVRVERLQDISDEDAIAEGCPGSFIPATCFNGEISGPGGQLPAEEFAELWESINGPGSWERNDWCWVLEFRRVEGGAT